MNLRTKLLGALGVLAAIAIGLGVASPAMADSSGPIYVTLNDVGTFSYRLWYDQSGRTLTATDVTTSQGGTSTGATVLEVTDTHTNSLGWTLTISASDFDDGAGHSIPASGFKITRVSTDGLSCGPNTVPSNPFQTLSPGTTPITLSTGGTVLNGTAGRGCGTRITQLDLSLIVPAGSYATDYTSNLTVTGTYGP